jgi:hypothetical protein
MGFFKNIGRGLGNAAKGAARASNNAVRGVKRATAPVGRAVESAAKNTGEFVADRASDAVETAGDAAQFVGKAAKGAVGKVGEGAVDVAENVGEFAGEVAERALDTAKDVGGVAKKVGGFVGDRFEDAGGLVEPVAQKVKQGAENLRDEVKRFGESVSDAAVRFFQNRIENDELAQRAIAEIKAHEKLVKALVRAGEQLKEPANYGAIIEDVVRPIQKGRIKGKEAERKLEALSAHPLVAELAQAAEEETGSKWGFCITIGPTIDLAIPTKGAQAAGGVVIGLPPALYGALSWSKGLAATASVDAQLGVWLRKVPALDGKFISTEVDLHLPLPQAGGIPVGASVTVSFDTEKLFNPLLPAPDENYFESGDLQGFVVSLGVGIGFEIFNRATGYTWTTAP